MTVAGISTFLKLEESKLHILKGSSDDAIVFKHGVAS